MTQPHTGPVCDEPKPALPGSERAKGRGLDWLWVWRSLLLRKWRLATVFLLTVAVYVAGLVLPIFTQHPVDMIAAGSFLLGLQRGFAGNVVIAGCDLHHYDPRSLRSRIGIVDQDTILFAGTIRENIAGVRTSR
jgi:ABC-type bacteriocin/lantibiotic exporter with double-glycine peptidase domain